MSAGAFPSWPCVHELQIPQHGQSWAHASRRVCLHPQPPCRAEVKLNEGQERAIEVASDAPLMVLTGGPGCGKTTAVQTIVKLWCAQKKMVRIAAPTGEGRRGALCCAVLCLGVMRCVCWVGGRMHDLTERRWFYRQASSPIYSQLPATAASSHLTAHHPSACPGPLQAVPRSAWEKSRASSRAPFTACWAISRAAPTAAGSQVGGRGCGIALSVGGRHDQTLQPCIDV